MQIKLGRAAGAFTAGPLFGNLVAVVLDAESLDGAVAVFGRPRA
jgi:predicted PhzF superfamily epimerase YddE/YHI9